MTRYQQDRLNDLSTMEYERPHEMSRDEWEELYELQREMDQYYDDLNN